MKNMQEFIDKINAVKKQDAFDLSCDEDLSIAIMNLISIEEHFFFSGAKTGKTVYYDLIDQTRAIRKDLLKKLIKEYEGEVWCVSKHLLAASMRVMEVGTKQLSAGKKQEAYALFDQAYSLYSLFWGLVLNVVSPEQAKKFDGHDPQTNVSRTGEPHKTNMLDSLKSLVHRAVNCCIE